MAFFEDIFKGGNIVTGLAIGIGAGVVAPALIPVLRPIAKTVIKAGLVAYDQGRVAFAELNEQTGDVLAEARSELAEQTDQEEKSKRSRKSEAAHQGT